MNVEGPLSIPAAYLGVVLIWSTTPLAIQWSGRDVSFLFGLMSRMVIGIILMIALHLLLKRRLRLDWPAWRIYLSGGTGLYAGMTCVYSAAQYIPSGWISVIFGATPLVTGVMAMMWLNERAFSASKILGIALSLSGLVVIFHSSQALAGSASLGVVLVLSAVFFHSLSAVWVKRLNPGLDGFTATSGSLLVATPLYIMTWWLIDGTLPESIPARAGTAILYLGIFGSVIGFTMYFFLLRHLAASRMSLITLMTPVLALWLGQWMNGEMITLSITVGTTIILSGLACYEWGDTIFKKCLNQMRRRRAEMK